MVNLEKIRRIIDDMPQDLYGYAARDALVELYGSWETMSEEGQPAVNIKKAIRYDCGQLLAELHITITLLEESCH
jgi:hypothetical protein